uniref:glycoside hydrolase family 25 protein n=1 Tax=Flavobacterium sp. TaxID=239 RepID=UPI0040492D14
MVYEYKDGFLYYLGFKTDNRMDDLSKEDRKIADIRIYEVLQNHEEHAFGFDVSEYQSKIQWDSIANLEETFQLSFVFIRATAGKDRKDKRFEENWNNAKKNDFIRGAYHYYRPNENSLKQADFFIQSVQLQKGDLPPVLDIEKLPKAQSLDSLKVGLRRWLVKVEQHYKVKPIIYSGESYYKDFLKDEFSDYPFWIANYNLWRKEIEPDWQFWQFSEKAKINGINGPVDVNVYNGNILKLVNSTNN